MGTANSRDAVIVDTSRSKFARLRPVPLNTVTLTDRFFAPKIARNRSVTLPTQYELLESTGRIDNFRRAAGKYLGDFQGRYYNDSDVYKWLEGVAWTLADKHVPELSKLGGIVSGEILAAQDKDGYLNTYFVSEFKSLRWQNLKDMHELYCAGHLIQAAIAYYRSTGEVELLECAKRFADLICNIFGPEEDGKRLGVPGHEEIEMALIELYRVSGEKRYLEQAHFFLNHRGIGLIGGSAYHQDDLPVRQRERMDGHAVRAVYLNAGIADLYMETGEDELIQALLSMWSNMTGKQMYISGGIGSRSLGEAFGRDYELPNASAYAETCGAIGSVMWNWRMLLITGEAKFSDVMELAIYNAVLVGLSEDGKQYFYSNPLEDDGTNRRKGWYDCACCPPNIARFLASLPGYFYSVSEESGFYAIWVHLYARNDAEIMLPNGQMIQLVQRNNYPWDGKIDITVEGAGNFGIYLRIPGWCGKNSTGDLPDNFRLSVNGVKVEKYPKAGSYLLLQRQWVASDVIELYLPMPIRLIESHPYIEENTEKAALMRGPILYCFESADNPGIDLRDIQIMGDRAPDVFQAKFRADQSDGIVTLEIPGEDISMVKIWGEELYRVKHGGSKLPHPNQPNPIKLYAVPYFSWANRQAGRMKVWLQAEPD